jgi:hypothetical protein
MHDACQHGSPFMLLLLLLLHGIGQTRLKTDAFGSLFLSSLLPSFFSYAQLDNHLV